MGISSINVNGYNDSNMKTQITYGKKYVSIDQLLNPAPQKEDSISFSAQSKTEARNGMNYGAGQYQSLLDQLENSNRQSDAVGKDMETRRKCMLIAMRIMSGDKVPMEDYRYLAKNDQGLYSRAVMMRMEKKNPKEYDRLSEDEEPGEEEGSGKSAAVAAAASTAGGESPAASEGGAESGEAASGSE